MVNLEYHQQFLDHWECKRKVQDCSNKRKEKYGSHLGIDALSDFRLCHSDILHNFKAGLVFITL